MFAYVGCRTTRERNARGRGITLLYCDGGAWSVRDTVESYANPSWLLMGAGGRMLYSVHGDFGDVSSFARDADTGQLTFARRVDCKGRNPVHLIQSPDHRSLYCANYATGTIGRLPLTQQAEAMAASRIVPLPAGQGPNRKEQNGPHPHQLVISPCGQALLVPDKGGDRVLIYGLGADGTISDVPLSVFHARAGAGPRHLVFHPKRPVVYLVGELDSTVITLDWDSAAKRLSPRDRTTTLPRSYCGENSAAAIDITPDGAWLFVTNRGHDSIAIFGVTDGAPPDLFRIIRTGGAVPRFMTLDPSARALWLAHEATDDILIVPVDDFAALDWGSRQKLAVPSPTSVVFARGSE